ncbi:MAG: DUF3426 domain-containing protein [Robiginitomaculum sp.]|nr:DUF3426 domain-containing protein [Robiginitomaculum sp.]MDQ7078808.1 DUF3426 domain-containing protein [Robiginitomaculum sp.]
MIITCPDCSTHYNVTAKALGQSGREVRCASCGHKWFATPEEALDDPAPSAEQSEEPAEDAAPEDSPETEAVDDFDAVAEDQTDSTAPAEGTAPDAEAAPAEEKETPAPAHKAYRNKLEAKAKRKRRLVALGAWGGVFVTLALLAFMAISFRDSIVRVFPKTAGTFDAIGMPADLWGVDLRNIKSERVREKGEDILRISGEVYNPGDKPRHAPLVRVSLRDETDEEIHAWTVPVNLKELPPKTSAVFSTSVRNPPPRAVNLGFDFTDKALKAETKTAAKAASKKKKSHKPKKKSKPQKASHKKAGH